jgi:hypothetical protein
MPVLSVNPTVRFENLLAAELIRRVLKLGCRIIRRYEFLFQLIQFSAFEFSVDSFASTLLP